MNIHLLTHKKTKSKLLMATNGLFKSCSFYIQKNIFLLFSIFFLYNCSAPLSFQQQGGNTLKIDVDTNCILYVDGSSYGIFNVGEFRNISLNEGLHAIITMNLDSSKVFLNKTIEVSDTSNKDIKLFIKGLKNDKSIKEIEWVSIPAGTFIMGSPITELEREKDEIQHQITLNAFKMSKYEITFEQYDAFCDATGREKPRDEGWGRDKRPVINVSWNDAVAFADWMGCRLPTEAEWEYACRAASSASATTTPFNTGSNLTTSQANYNGYSSYNGNANGTYRLKTLPVGCFPPNKWGLYDMHGNVWEWCSDWYALYINTSQINPKGPGLGLRKVMRGGGWYGGARRCRSAYRDGSYPQARVSRCGIRLVSDK